MDIKKIGEELSSVILKYETFTLKKEVGETLARRLNEIKLKQIRKRRILSYSVAASVTILVAIGFYMIPDKQFHSQREMLAISLPDNSQVSLEANSSLSYNRILWYFRRSIRLKGDGRFKVTSGEQFRVKTVLGDIRVLGTEFSVRSSNEKLDVECFEGSVEVTTKTGGGILHRGDIIECTPTENILTPRPDYYQYKQASMSEVLERIESIYGVTIPQKESYAEQIFDGVITTQNLTEALDVLTLSCNMNYKIENNIITITTNE